MTSTAAAIQQEPDWFGTGTESYAFRPVHYLGSKLRVLGEIGTALDRLDPARGAACDLFSGSATVSRSLSGSRRVVSLDIQEYARVLASAVLNGDRHWTAATATARLNAWPRLAQLEEIVAPLAAYEEDAMHAARRGDLAPLCDLLEYGSIVAHSQGRSEVSGALGDAMCEVRRRLDRAALVPSETVCLRHYGGLYFGYRQAAQLDALTSFARSASPPSDLLLAAVLSTASQIVNTVGKQFAQPIRPRDKSGEPKHHLLRKIATERGLQVLPIYRAFMLQYFGLKTRRTDHTALRGDFRERLPTLKGQVSIVYADPPYTRDHYSRFYHALETIAQGDDPDISATNLDGGEAMSRGSYRADRHQSPFCIKSQAPGAFRDLFNGVQALGVPLVLSYSGFDSSVEARPRVMSVSDVAALARESFASVEVTTLDSLDHMKLNATALNKSARGTHEVLFLCR